MDDFAQLSNIKIEPIASFGPFVLKKDYYKHIADLTSTIMLQDQIIEWMQGVICQYELKVQKLENANIRKECKDSW